MNMELELNCSNGHISDKVVTNFFCQKQLFTFSNFPVGNIVASNKLLLEFVTQWKHYKAVKFKIVSNFNPKEYCYIILNRGFEH